MDSKLYLEEKVDNKDRKFGANQEYYPVYFIDKDGNEIKGLFTKNQIAVAVQRANRNPEDFEEDRGFWDWLFG